MISFVILKNSVHTCSEVGRFLVHSNNLIKGLKLFVDISLTTKRGGANAIVIYIVNGIA